MAVLRDNSPTGAAVPETGSAGTSGTASRRTGGMLLFLALLCLPLYFTGIDDKAEPYVNAEARCAEISATMFETGEVLIPRLNGQAHLTKPPLFHWLAYLVSKVRGAGGLGSVRLTSALAATATIILTFLLGLRLFNPASAWLSALLLATSITFLQNAHRGTFDVCLTAFVTLTFLGYALLDQPGKTALAAAALVTGLAGGFLTKGPVAWLIPAVPMAMDWWVGRKERRAAVAMAALLAALVLAVSTAWYAYLLLAVPEARTILQDALLVNFGVRSQVYEMAYHGEPFYYYLWMTPLCLLPWVLLSPWAFSHAAGATDANHPWQRQYRLLACWFFWGLLMFSCIPAKAPRYLLPLLPPFFLLLGARLAALETVDNDLRRRCRTFLRYGLVTLLLLMAVSLPLWLWLRLGEPRLACLAAGIWCASFALAGIAWGKRLRLSHMLLGFAAMLAVNSAFAYGRWLPAHQFIHEHNETPQAQQYQARMKWLKEWRQHGRRQ